MGLLDTLKGKFKMGAAKKKTEKNSYKEDKSDYEVEAEKRRKEREKSARDKSNRQKRYTKQQLGESPRD